MRVLTCACADPRGGRSPAAQVRPFIKSFRRLDIDGNGRLGSADLELAVKDPSRVGKVNDQVMRQIRVLTRESTVASDLRNSIEVSRSGKGNAANLANTV